LPNILAHAKKTIKHPKSSQVNFKCHNRSKEFGRLPIEDNPKHNWCGQSHLVTPSILATPKIPGLLSHNASVT